MYFKCNQISNQLHANDKKTPDRESSGEEWLKEWNDPYIEQCLIVIKTNVTKI